MLFFLLKASKDPDGSHKNKKTKPKILQKKYVEEVWESCQTDTS